MRTVLLLLLATLAVAETVELREWLGLHWTRELVHRPIDPPADATVVHLVDEAGQPVPAQLTADGAVAFVTDLGPGQQRTWTVHYEAPPQPLDTNLRIDGNRMATSAFGAVLNLGGERFDPPAEPNTVPGPVATMLLGDGSPFGSSTLYGETPVVAWSGSVAGGPVVATATWRYEYADGRRMTLVARLTAGDCKLRWSMQVDPVDPEQVQAALFGGGAGDAGKLELPTARDGWRLYLDPGLEDLTLIAIPEFFECKWGKHEYIGGRWVADPVHVLLRDEPVGWIADLVPWSDWWKDTTKVEWQFATAGRDPALRLTARRPGEWVEPAPPGSILSHGNLRASQKQVPMVRDEAGRTYLQFSLASGARNWELGAALEVPENRPNQRPGGGHDGEAGIGHRLDEIANDCVLNWPRNPDVRHPLLFMTMDEVIASRETPRDPELLETIRRRAFGGIPKTPGWDNGPHGNDDHALGLWLLTGDPEIAADTHLVARLEHHLALLGRFDVMRLTATVAALYDALRDSDLVDPTRRPVYDARMAYLGYYLRDPAVWSLERGYCSGNPNMHVAYLMAAGLLACTLPDHPQAEAWAAPSVAMTEQWLEQVGPKGEWHESVSNYANVTAGWLLSFAIAARRAGHHDFIADPRLQLFLEFLAKQYTPPDPRGGGDRKAGCAALPPSGRAGAGARWMLPGMMSRAARALAPEYAAHQQWLWGRACHSYQWGASRLGGFAFVYADPGLPATLPPWASELFPEIGVLFRQGLGTTEEHYLNAILTDNLGWYEAESGGLAGWWAYGTPLQCRFAGAYREREALFISRVLPARRRGDQAYRAAHFSPKGPRSIAAFAALPQQDYAAFELEMTGYRELDLVGRSHYKQPDLPAWPPVAADGKLPIEWRRQLLYLKGDDPADPAGLILRDTVLGGEPTIWQFWTVSETIDVPAAVADREAALAAAPGAAVREPRELSGDRFTAIGQFGIDLDIFVAAPTDTPRHTLRWGRKYGYVPVNQFEEWQDLLHLQMPGDGAYLVALYPRPAGAPVPIFSRLGSSGIRVDGQWGTDTILLLPEPGVYSAGDLHFRGTAASIRERPGERVLNLGAAGELRAGDHGITAEGPAALHIVGTAATVTVPPADTVREVTVHLPGGVRTVRLPPGQNRTTP